MRTPTWIRRWEGRPRIVAWIVAVTALGLTLLILAVSFGLRATVRGDIERSLEQEAGEVQRFAESGRDPDTGGPFASVERFVDVYLARQHPEDAELLAGGLTGAEQPAQARGSAVPGFSELEAEVRMQLMEPGTSGSLHTRAHGRISWRTVEVTAPQSRGALTVVLFHDPLEAQIRWQLGVLALLAAGSLLATGLVAWVVSGRIMGHVVQFEDAAAALPAGVGLVRFPEDGSDEYRRLARAANRALATAEDVAERERRFNEDLAQTVRTPLAILQGGLEQPGETPHQQALTRSAALQEVRRLRELVGSLVQLNQAETVERVPPGEGVRLDAFAGRQVALWQERLGGSGVRVELGLTVGVRVSADEARLGQALDQLIANAVDASPSGAVVEIGTDVHLDDDGQYAVLEVVDSGRGVPEGETETILERFVVASNDPDPGPGLGLTLADRLVVAMGGRLTVHARDGMPGTVVRVWLPR